ncbi:hypothetical protein FJ661_05030 [Pseudarthrobacter phenanthrenivorans]|uniref:Secreted protein n=1 Tax=Pseudarthrobacter phenanthrenivorans (strain DSM 18606 / JCM 16027 / LMG 23796 / Sphe3) TaxID=930171 RepID=F0MBY0_PSEPM|nr:hypothetical protein [Pseudarthrobacter phenanthrenivorans]ADX74121.1 hypothetical protein Asphe3_30100 [Pseudarthrobacter phenanthrenivorans Sphe3]TPV52657.1 hypothetical protein FJ661_05030 [Pseudarthrobacter phenanthrenivorans]
MKTTRTLRAAATASAASALLLVASAGAAVADHTHVKVVGNGGCVIMAQGAGEADVDLPGAVFENNPHAADLPQTDGRTHPLHVLVHQGVPGENNALYVLGSDAEKAACGGKYVNR